MGRTTTEDPAVVMKEEEEDAAEKWRRGVSKEGRWRCDERRMRSQTKISKENGSNKVRTGRERTVTAGGRTT
jgi:hypothetical protein